jgi:Fur family ferric uptake transcriptional regulator
MSTLCGTCRSVTTATWTGPARDGVGSHPGRGDGSVRRQCSGAAAYIGRVTDLGQRLHAAGKRLTPQRVRVLDVVRAQGHVTPDEVVAALAAQGMPTPASTVYRSLDALQELGLVTHTHVDHRVPSYHLVEHGAHVHLACRRCGWVGEADPAGAAGFVEELRSRQGFVADLTHAAIHGLCAQCAEVSR